MSGQSGSVASATTTAGAREGQKCRRKSAVIRPHTTPSSGLGGAAAGQHPGRTCSSGLLVYAMLELSVHRQRPALRAVSAAETPHTLLARPRLTCMPQLGQSACERCLDRHRATFGPHSSAEAGSPPGAAARLARVQMRTDAAVNRTGPLAPSDRGAPGPLCHWAHSTAQPASTSGLTRLKLTCHQSLPSQTRMPT